MRRRGRKDRGSYRKKKDVSNLLKKGRQKAGNSYRILLGSVDRPIFGMGIFYYTYNATER